MATDPRQSAEYGRWEVCRVVVADGVREDEQTLNERLAEGWEPFAAAIGVGGHNWYLRRRMQRVNREALAEMRETDNRLLEGGADYA